MIQSLPGAEQPIAPGTVWITGLPASGKTTLSTALHCFLQERGYPCALLDGEVLRQNSSCRYGYSLEERFEVLRELIAVALAKRERGLIPIVATISHKREMRTLARQALDPMLEVYLECDAPVCAARDQKGHYRRAYAGEYTCFIGVTEPYEIWENLDIRIDTANSSIEEATRKLIAAAVDFLGASRTALAAPLLF